jgi:hypothetical protein
VVVKSAFAHPSSLTNLCHTCGVVASFRKKLSGSFEDVIARFFAAMLHDNSYDVVLIPTGRYDSS